MRTEFDSPSAAEPFAPGPSQFSGCGKPAVIGCLVLLVLLAAGLVVLMWKAQDLLRFAIGEYRVGVMSSLPDDLEPDERRELDAAFEAALTAIESGRLEPAALQGLQRALASPPKPGQTLSREEVRDLTRALQEVGGTVPAPEVPDVPGGAAALVGL